MASGPVELLFGVKPKVTIGVVTLDASISEKHTKSNEVTKHPVETGKDVSDHIRHHGDRIEIEGVISNTPLFFLASLASSGGTGLAGNLFSASPVRSDTEHVTDRAKRADQAFSAAMDSGELLTVVTSIRTYKNMAMVDYAVTRDKDTGNILSFNIGLEEVVIVSTQTIDVPKTANPANGADQNLGNKAVKAPTKNPNTTILDDFSHAAIKFGRSG